MMRLATVNPMNRALAGLLACEGLAFGLALPVMLTVSHASVAGSVTVTSVALIAAFAGAATMKRSLGMWFGWTTQLLGFAMGIFTPAMILMAGVFTAIWVAGVVLGRKIDRATEAG